MSTSISLEFHLSGGKCGHKTIRKGKKPKHAKPTCLQRITRLMALAIKYETLIAEGVVKDHEALARLTGVDQGLISRILRLRLLSPKIQEALLNLQETARPRDQIQWGNIRKITRIADWNEQESVFEGMIVILETPHF